MNTKNLLLLALLGGALPVAASAQDRVDTTVAIGRDGRVELGIVAGSIRVRASDRRDVRVIATIDRGRFEFSASGSRVSLRTRSTSNRQGNASVELQVPQGTRVTAASVSGDITIHGTAAEVNATTVSGDITITDARDRIDAESVSGDIRLESVQGRIDVESVSGDVVVERVDGDVDAETVSGDVRVARSRLRSLRVESVSGTLSYQGNVDSNGSYRLNTHSGGITLTLPPNASARLELETFSGRISSDFAVTLQPGRDVSRGRKMEFTIGDGGARITAGAFSGSISIRRGSATSDRE